jgi:hypothetical protein
MKDIEIRGPDSDFDTNAMSAVRITFKDEAGETVEWPDYAISVGSRSKHGRPTIKVYHLSGKNLPYITIDAVLMKDHPAFLAPHTVEKAREAYFAALAKAPNLAQVFEQAVAHVQQEAKREGRSEIQSEFRQLLGVYS